MLGEGKGEESRYVPSVASSIRAPQECLSPSPSLSPASTQGGPGERSLSSSPVGTSPSCNPSSSASCACTPSPSRPCPRAHQERWNLAQSPWMLTLMYRSWRRSETRTGSTSSSLARSWKRLSKNEGASQHGLGRICPPPPDRPSRPPVSKDMGRAARTHAHASEVCRLISAQCVTGGGTGATSTDTRPLTVSLQ